MTKRDLVKYLENKAKEARERAAKRKAEMINEAQECIYEEIGVNAFVAEVVPMYEEILKKYQEYFEKIHNTEGVSISPYYYKLGYNALAKDLTDVDSFKKIVAESTRISSAEYNEVVSQASEHARKVASTYDTVVMTVKNLPTAKDGLEYLKKLGFDVSEIEPVKHEKQLPATTSVNVDVKYLLLGK